MRRISVVLIGLAILAMGSTPGVGAEKGAPVVVSIGTHPVGSFFNTVGTAAAKTISEHSGIRAMPKPMAGPAAWYPYMERGDMELGVLNVWDAEKGYLGESTYEKLSNKKGFPVRLLAVTVWNAGGVVVAKDSGIHSYSDLKGKKVAGNFPTPSLQLQTEAYLANGNVSWQEITPVPVNSVVEGVKMVIDGRADASGTVTLGMGAIEELQAKKGARILLMNPAKEALERTRKLYPGYPIKVAPGAGNTGIEKEGHLWAYDIYLIVSEKVPEKTVYDMTRALYENTKDFEKVHKLLKDWTPPRFVSREATVPYHSGAIKFYKEKGAWTPEMARLQEELLKKKKK